MEEETMLQGMRRNFELLERVHAAHKAALAAFPAAAGDAAAAKEMAPAAAEAAIAAESEAADHAQVKIYFCFPSHTVLPLSAKMPLHCS